MRGLTKEYREALFCQKGQKDFEQIKKVLSDKEHFFLGVRKNYLSLYYKGMSIARIEEKKGAFKYYMSEYYRDRVEGYEEKTNMPSEVFWEDNNFESMKEKIKMHVFGEHNGDLKLEKVCQQWIMNQANKHVSSEWYYVDMEYVYDETPIDMKGSTEHPYGRADMIAIKKQPNEAGIHEVAFVELKVGSGAYGGCSISGKTEDKRKEQEKLFGVMREKGLHEKCLDNIKLGSGLVSHLADFIRLFAHPEYYQNKIREELINMLDIQKKVGMLAEDSLLAKIDDVSKLASKPDIYIVSYGSVPELSKNDVFEGSQHRFVDEQIKSMKRSFYKYLYTSKYSAKKVFKEKDIDSILCVEEQMAKFSETEEEFFEFEQQIKGEQYRFIFGFVDPSRKDEAWNCLK